MNEDAMGAWLIPVAVSAGVLMLSGCSSGTSNSALERARQAGASEQAQREVQASLNSELQQLKEQTSRLASASPVPDPTTPPSAVTPAPATTSCGNNLSVGPNTSCGFAENVASAFYSSGQGSARIQAWSPTTATYYTMSCVSGIPTVCRGGNNAVVYIR